MSPTDTQVWGAVEASLDSSPFEYGRGDAVLLWFDDLIDLIRPQQNAVGAALKILHRLNSEGGLPLDVHASLADAIRRLEGI